MMSWPAVVVALAGFVIVLAGLYVLTGNPVFVTAGFTSLAVSVLVMAVRRG